MYSLQAGVYMACSIDPECPPAFVPLTQDLIEQAKDDRLELVAKQLSGRPIVYGKSACPNHAHDLRYQEAMQATQRALESLK